MNVFRINRDATFDPSTRSVWLIVDAMPKEGQVGIPTVLLADYASGRVVATVRPPGMTLGEFISEIDLAVLMQGGDHFFDVADLRPAVGKPWDPEEDTASLGVALPVEMLARLDYFVDIDAEPLDQVP